MLYILLISCTLSLSALCLVSAASAEELPVSRFSSDGLSGWEVKSFNGLTEYRLTMDNGRIAVKATSDASASGLIRKIRFATSKYRTLRWSWKIARTVKGGDEKLKTGDDYAARLYVVFPGRFFWQTKAISYIWANRLAKGETIPNIYTSNVQMVAVETGNEKAGQWLAEERDLRADYRALFGGEPRDAEAIAIMTDSDNTGGRAEAWYGEIVLVTEDK